MARWPGSVLAQAAIGVAAVLPAAAALAQRVAVPAAPAASAAPSQTLAEFLDSLADNVLSADRSQLYRVEGQRHIVGLRSGWTLTLDEQSNGRLSNSGAGPGTAGPPGKSLEFARDAEDWRWRLYTLRDSTGRESGLQGVWTLAPGWQLRGQTFHLRDDDSGVGRHENEFSLRWGEPQTWVEALLRQASLDDPRLNAAGLGQPSATFAGLRAAWQAPQVPGLTLQATAQAAVDSKVPPGGDERLAGARTELGADYHIDPSLLPGARLYWREAFRLGLLASEGLEERTTYRRIVGGEVSDGSPGGRYYLQWREHSLSDARNALLVAGWSHSFEPAPRWRLGTLVEQAEPVAGPNPIRSTTLGLNATHGAHPDHSLQIETEVVRSAIKDSAYGAVNLTNRLTENTLGVWRLSLAGAHPYDPGGVPSTELKASAGWAWREPEHRLLYTLWRYTFVDRQMRGDTPPQPDASDRHAHIVLGQIGNHWGEADASLWSLRGQRRWDHDQAIAGGSLRTTTLWVARATVPLQGRWSVSTHVATRRDSLQPSQNGLGAELGYQLSDKAALALGLNLKGIDDSELEVDERLHRGLTLRLRFSIDAAAARWLDPPMDEVRAAREGRWR